MRGLILFILGVIVGVFGLRWYQREQAAHRRDLIAEWHLSPDEIRADLARTGQVARSRLEVAGSQMADARIVAVIKAKYLLDSQLSAFSISVTSRGGTVTLDGSVTSPELIGRAVALALNTDGVH